MPPIGDQVFNTWVCGDSSYSKHNKAETNWEQPRKRGKNVGMTVASYRQQEVCRTYGSGSVIIQKVTWFWIPALTPSVLPSRNQMISHYLTSWKWGVVLKLELSKH
jgi:hypothetical protein